LSFIVYHWNLRAIAYGDPTLVTTVVQVYILLINALILNTR